MLEVEAGDGRVRLPSAATLSAPEGRRWSLPGERLVSILGVDLRQETRDDWQCVALDSRSLEAGLAARTTVDHLLAPSQTAAGVAADELVLGLWLDPGRLLTFASLLRRTLEQVPLVSRRRLRYWQDVETLLRPLEGLELVAIEARQSHQVPSAGADRVRLRLVDRTLVN